MPRMVSSEGRGHFRYPIGVALTTSAWAALAVGGGGYQSKMAITPSGMIVSAPDTFGIYLGSTTLGVVHQQLITPSSFPTGYNSPYLCGNINDIAVDPQNDNNLWIYYCTSKNVGCSTVLKSIDKGAHWTLTGHPLTSQDANGTLHPNTSQMFGVDPVNSNVAYVGGHDALRRTIDGGTTFSTVRAHPAPTNPGMCGVAFDPTSGTTTLSGQTVTARILFAQYSGTGAGVYESHDGGATFTLIASSPTGVTRGIMASDGNYYAVSDGSTTIKRINTSNTMFNIVCDAGVGAFAINPANPAQGIAWDNIGGGCITFNGAINSGTPPAGTHNGTSSMTITANDCGWLSLTGVPVGHPSLGPIIWDQQVTTSVTSMTIGTANNVHIATQTGKNYAAGDKIRVSLTGSFTTYMLCTVVSYDSALGDLVVNTGSYNEGTAGTFPYLGQATGGSGTFSAWTITKERLWYSCGVGLIYIDAPSYQGALSYISQTLGIESLSSSAVVWPPSNNPQLLASDFPIRVQSTNPIGATIGAATYEPSQSFNAIVDGVSVCAAISDPTKMFCVAGNFAGESTDGGLTYTPFITAPTLVGGSSQIAASTPLNIVIAGRNSSTVVYTTDGGVTWNPGTGQQTGSPGGGFSQFEQNVNFLEADPVTAGTFYRYSSPRIDRSTDGGQTWASWAASLTSNNALFQMKCVPGRSGQLFVSFGPQGFSGTTWADVLTQHPATGGPGTATNWNLFFVNGGTSTPLPNAGEPLAIGIGAAKPGGNGYPSIYFAGWVFTGGVWVYSPCWAIYNFDPANIAATTYVNIGASDKAIDWPQQLAGSPQVFDFVIQAFNGSGWAFRGYTGKWP